MLIYEALNHCSGVRVLLWPHYGTKVQISHSILTYETLMRTKWMKCK